MRALLAALLLFALPPPPAAACYCNLQTICQRMNGAEVIFLGETAYADDRQTIVRVVERFRGLREDVGQVEIEAFFAGSCPSPYRQGERVLAIVDRGPNGELRDGPCSRSFVVTGANPAVALIRRLASGQIHTLLHGFVATPGDRSGWDVPVEGAIVEAEHDGQTYSTTSNEEGQYEFANLPPGDYRIRPRALGYRNIRGAADATVPPTGCVERELALTTTNSLSGLVIDAAKRPVADMPVALYRQDIQPDKPAKETTTGSDGEIRFRTLPPGSYHLLVNPGGPTPEAPYDPVFFPGVAERANALAVYVGPAAEVAGQNVSLGRRHATRWIEIAMTWPDGSPANGHVVCTDAQSGAREETIGVAGTARCAALADRPYEVRVSTTPDLGRSSVEPWKTVVPPAATDARLEVVLPEIRRN